MVQALADLGIEHYQWAEVRLVICIDEALKQHRLIFCTVTLHPDYLPKPEPVQDSLKSNNTEAQLFFRRVVMPAEQAVTWYAELGDALPILMPFDTQEAAHKYNDIKFFCPGLLNEMEWPSLGMPLSKSADLTGFKTFNPAPFISEINSRIHRKFGDTDGLLELVGDENTVDFIERAAHINLQHYTEYLASACLVVPNPLIQKVDNFLIRKKNTEVVFHRFIARPGKSLDGLKITIREENNSLLTLMHTQTMPENGIIELERPKCMGKYGYEVTHEQYGLILRHQPAGFLRQVQFSSGIIDKQFTVTAPIGSKKNAKEKTYTSSHVVKASENIVGVENVPHNFNARVALASEQRRLKAAASEYDQKFFSADSREEAIDFIHTIISRAKHKILIADPYFSHLQETQFLYAVRNAAVKIEIITSKNAFTGNAAERKEKSKLLEKSLQRLWDQTKRKASAKVLTGDKPILHDRFLVVDNNVWFMGNSLADIGQRASMVLKVPYPDAVINELLTIQQAAISLDEFIG